MRMKTYLIGILLSVVLIFMAHYSISIVHGSYLAIDHIPAGGIFIFFVLVILINPLLALIRRSYELSSGELLIIYTMLLVTSSITTMGLGAQLLPMITAPFYFATAENRWAVLMHPHMRDWLHPSGDSVVRHFYEGLPAGETIPWMAWVGPVMMWFILIFALYMAMLFIMVILRKQWVEKEKMTYPLVQLPVEMIRDSEKKTLLKPLFRSKLFWLGASMPLIISSVNALHSYFHFFPLISLNQRVEIFQRTVPLYFWVSFPIMGISYFIKQDVALGVWFFNLLYMAVRGIFNIVGISSAEIPGPYSAGGAIFANFGMGAFIGLVAISLWMAREHLKEVFGKAFGKTAADDSQEIVSYKVAVWGLLLSSALIIAWLIMSGMSVSVALLFYFFAMVIFIGITRIVAETGIPFLRGPANASSQVISSMGSSRLSHESLTSLALTYSYQGDLRTFPMVAMAQGLKLGDWIKRRRKGGMFAAMIIAVFVAYFVSNWLILRLAYTHGGLNLNRWFFVGAPERPYNFMVLNMLHPAEASISGWGLRGLGAMMMGGMMLARYRFLWWPFHPVGFAVGTMSGAAWFSIFLAWLIKALMLKYGGVKVFRAGKPLFLGMILGQYSAAAIWLIIDYFTGHTGNMVFYL